jgi:ABC-type uncharacterized transport system permease subunit
VLGRQKDLPARERWEREDYITFGVGIGLQIAAAIYGATASVVNGGNAVDLAISTLLIGLALQVFGSKYHGLRAVAIVILWIVLGAIVIFGNSGTFIGCLCS